MIQWCIIIFAHFKLRVLPSKNGCITVIVKRGNLVGWEDVCDIMKVSFVGIRVINHEKMTITLKKRWILYNLISYF